jgi:hypothetical protein
MPTTSTVCSQKWCQHSHDTMKVLTQKHQCRNRYTCKAMQKQAQLRV